MNTIVTETTELGEVPINIYQKLASDRILFICNNIDDKLATAVVAALILKDSEDPEKKITIFINSEGGDIRSVLMIYDIMSMIRAPIETVCIGAAMDEAVIILAAGTAGMRFAAKHSAIAVSQLINNWMAYSDLTDAKKSLEQSVSDNKKMMEILAKCMGKPLKEVMTLFERRVFMGSAQAAKLNLIDKVVPNNK